MIQPDVIVPEKDLHLYPYVLKVTVQLPRLSNFVFTLFLLVSLTPSARPSFG